MKVIGFYSARCMWQFACIVAGWQYYPHVVDALYGFLTDNGFQHPDLKAWLLYLPSLVAWLLLMAMVLLMLVKSFRGFLPAAFQTTSVFSRLFAKWGLIIVVGTLILGLPRTQAMDWALVAIAMATIHMSFWYIWMQSDTIKKAGCAFQHGIQGMKEAWRKQYGKEKI